MAILIGSFSLALLAPEMQGESTATRSLFLCWIKLDPDLVFVFTAIQP